MSEPLFKNQKDDDETTAKHDGFDLLGSFLTSLNIWTAILIFIVFMLYNTHFFIDEIIKKINSDFVSINGNLTSSGIIVQGVLLSISYILIDLLVSNEVL